MFAIKARAPASIDFPPPPRDHQPLFLNYSSLFVNRSRRLKAAKSLELKVEPSQVPHHAGKASKEIPQEP